MNSHSQKMAVSLFVMLFSTGVANAQDAGMAYRWRSPGAFFGDPTPISDRDESSQSGSSFRVAYLAEPESDSRSRDILVGTYTIVPNPSLGYAYAGFAIPFNTPMGLEEEAAFRFDARSVDGIERLELVMRDKSRRRATHVLTLAPSTDWTTITVPASHFASLDTESIENAAIVVLSPGSGQLEISNVHLPVRSLATELTILEEIRTAPKWYPNAEMGVRVAKRLNRPVLVRMASSPDANEARMQGPAWRQVMEQTVNISLTDESKDTLPEEFVTQARISSEPSIMLFEADGSLLMSTGVSDVNAQAIAALLAKRAKEPAR